MVIVALESMAQGAPRVLIVQRGRSCPSWAVLSNRSATTAFQAHMQVAQGDPNALIALAVNFLAWVLRPAQDALRVKAPGPLLRRALCAQRGNTRWRSNMRAANVLLAHTKGLKALPQHLTVMHVLPASTALFVDRQRPVLAKHVQVAHSNHLRDKIRCQAAICVALGNGRAQQGKAVTHAVPVPATVTV